MNCIHLIYTQKSRREISQKERERLNIIVQAAAEQSKNYSPPVIKNPISFEELIDVYTNDQRNYLKLYADTRGQSLISLSRTFSFTDQHEILYLVGPEGGLTHQESLYALEHGFIPIKLTHTTLRALQATTLGVGILRSL